MIASDTGKPLVQHVVDQARKCRMVRNVIVATDDHRVVSALKPFNTVVTMTAPEHPSGTDRIWQVVREWPGETVVNVQGDEPEIEPETIDALVTHLESSGAPIATCATRFPADADPNDPNLVKVAIGDGGQAVYFSRAPIPFHRDVKQASDRAFHLHLGIYAYRWEALQRFTALKPGRLEQIEKLEQLRALENGMAIQVVMVDRATHGIDTREQYDQFVMRYRQLQRS